MISDALLRTYVDEIFMTYDRDKSGSLQPVQLANFFNDVFERLNTNERFTMEQALNAMMQVDTNFDGRASKNQLFNCLKRLMSQGNLFSSNAYNYNYQGSYRQPLSTQSTNLNVGYNEPLSTAATMISTGYAPNYIQNDTFFNETTNKLRPQQLVKNIQPGNISKPSYNSNTYTSPDYSSSHGASENVIISQPSNEQGYRKITTTKGEGYSNVTTQTYSSSTTTHKY